MDNNDITPVAGVENPERAIIAPVGTRTPEVEFTGQRGVALIIVLSAIVILSATVAQFSYSVRVNIAITGHVERETQAYFAARSGVMVALFVLEAKEVVDSIVKQYGSVINASNTQNIEIWRAVKPLCDSLSSSKFNLFGIDLVNMEGVAGTGMPEGQSFTCDLELEDGKINLNRITTLQDKQAIYSELRGLFYRYFTSDLFDENERLVDEVIAAIIDWADADDNKTQVEQGIVQESTGGAGEGGGRYSKYGYKVKNAKYDSIEELRYVDGIDDGHYCILKDRVTVYDTEKLNVNTADLETIKGLVCSNLTDKGLYYCNPQYRSQGLITPIDIIGEYLEMCRQVRNQMFMPPFTSAQSFVDFFTRIQVMPQLGLGTLPLDKAALQKRVGVRGKVWRVTAKGQSGNVTQDITVVLDTSTGKIVYWRE